MFDTATHTLNADNPKCRNRHLPGEGLQRPLIQMSQSPVIARFVTTAVCFTDDTWCHRKPCSSSPFTETGFHFAVGLLEACTEKQNISINIELTL